MNKMDGISAINKFIENADPIVLLLIFVVGVIWIAGGNYLIGLHRKRLIDEKIEWSENIRLENICLKEWCIFISFMAICVCLLAMALSL